MSTTTTLDTLKINYLTQAQYDAALANSEINENEIYLTPQDSSSGETDPVFSASAAAGITSSDITNWNSKTSNTGTVTGMTTTAGSHTAGAQTVSNGIITTNIPTKTSHLTNDSGFITSYTDEQLKWTASTSTNTYYPLQSTSTATTSTANTLNGINFYQYYNTAGGYRRLNLGNATSWKSTGGAYGTIRLYGAAATYYGDLVPGVLGTTSGDGHISANRTWTLPDKTGTVALTSDIPIVPTNISAFTNDSGYITSADVPEGASAYTGTISAVGTSASAGSNNGFARGDHVHNITKTTIDTQLGTGSGTTKFYREDGTWQVPAYTTNTDTTYALSGALSSHKFTSTLTAGGSGSGTSTTDFTLAAGTGITITDDTSNRKMTIACSVTNTDENVTSTAVTAATTNYIVGSTTSTTTTGGLSKHASAVLYTTADSGTSGYTQLRLGNTTATSSAGGKEGQIRLYGTTATYYIDLKAGAPSANRTITFPNKGGTVALTDDIPDVSGFITSDSDEKVAVAALTSGTTYYPILATGTGTATRQIDSTLGGLKYVSTAGTTSAVGTARLQLGNGTASGTANNEQGVIRLYGTTAYYTDIKAESGLPAANRTIYVPSYAGTMYLTCTSTTDAVGGATTAPVYVDNTGRIQAVTSIPYSLLTGTPTIPTDTNTTYTLTNALSSHKFTWTFTAGGSGSGSTTTTAELVAGTGITLTDDTTNKKITIASSVTNTDENVKSTAGGASMSAYYLTGSANSATETGTLVKHADIYAAHNPSGASITIGGNDTYHYRGWINLYSNGASYYATLQPADNYTANRTLTFPDKTGTVALTDDIPTIVTEGDDQLGFIDGDDTFYVPRIDFDTNTILDSILPASGVTAGTYDGGSDTKNGFYIPSFTVDDTGRITSATDLGALIPFVTPYYSSVGVLSGSTYGMLFKSISSGTYDGYISTSETSKTITISAGDSYMTTVWGVIAYGISSLKPVIVDWTSSAQSVSSQITVTVSIAEAYTENIYFKILTTNTTGM